MSYLIFGGKDLTAFYNCKISSSEGKFTAPSRDYEVIKIPGKSGDLLLDNQRLNNFTVRYKCYINGNFEEQYRNLMRHLLGVIGYSTLSDSDGFEARAYFLGNVEPKMSPKNLGGTFELMFSCDPNIYEVNK